MAANTSEVLEYVIELEVAFKDYLAQIRHWDNLKIASESTSIWIKNFTKIQVDSVELQSIPFIHHYTCKGNLLFPRGSSLPLKKIPNLLWSPIDKALKISLNNYNHNLFDYHPTIDIKLKESEIEVQSSVLLVDIIEANTYVSNASSIRLKNIKWTIINNTTALFMGEPMLPINGKSFWQKNQFIFPTGYALEFDILEKYIQQKINPLNNSYVFWYSKYDYLLIDKDKMNTLSIYSWKQTLNL